MDPRQQFTTASTFRICGRPRRCRHHWLEVICTESIMQRSTIRTSSLTARSHPHRFWLPLGLLVLAGSAFPAGQPTTTVGGPAGQTKVPAWDARGLGPLPWQGIACVDMTADGKFVA